MRPVLACVSESYPNGTGPRKQTHTHGDDNGDDNGDDSLAAIAGWQSYGKRFVRIMIFPQSVHCARLSTCADPWDWRGAAFVTLTVARLPESKPLTSCLRN